MIKAELSTLMQGISSGSKKLREVRQKVGLQAEAWEKSLI